MQTIPVGHKGEATVRVAADNVASTVGSGTLDVFATPMMIALLEQAASSCIQSFLDDNQTSVGTAIRVEHVSPTPIGMNVTAAVTVIAVDGRSVEFEAVIRDEAGEIGKGSHSRIIVDKDKFMNKAAQKNHRI